MVRGGPFADGDDRGAVGMAAIAAPHIGEAERLASKDQSVERGLLTARVGPWTVRWASP